MTDEYEIVYLHERIAHLEHELVVIFESREKFRIHNEILSKENESYKMWMDRSITRIKEMQNG